MLYADLELGLHRRDADSYVVDLRYVQPDSDAEIRLVGAEPAVARFDFPTLRALELTATAYGQALTAALFATAELRRVFAQARAAAASLNSGLRLRIFVGSSAPELHALRWELLRDPERDAPLLTGEQVIFSRYLASGDWRPIQLRARAELRALAVAANPAGLDAYGMAVVDVAGELARAREHLAPIIVDTLPDGRPATLAAIVERLRDSYDMLYLACHGTLAEGEPYLWLEDEQGRIARVSGVELATRIQELRERPRLIVLASCASGQMLADGGPLAAVGPRLAEAGVPAVLAMQGNITLTTVAGFMPVFFKELQRDGLIDRAVAVARGAVRERDDSWMPALFMRLRSGAIWYTPGFGASGETFEKWPAILSNIRRGNATPIIAPNLAEPLFGSAKELAQRWADAYRFPMAPHQREDLPQVAQFLAVNQQRQYPREQFGAYLKAQLLERFGAQLDPTLVDAPIWELVAAVGDLRRAADSADPFGVLAALPFPIYLTASTDNLLSSALRAAGKEPEVELCRWNKELEHIPSVFDADAKYEPSAQRPLVFHLFGVNAVPESLVLTEDDYFDYLIGVSLNKELIPYAVREALADTALLFLGFRLEDWNFRVLFRSIMRQEGGLRRRRYANIAGQIMPEEGAFLDPERARRYLTDYFDDAEIAIFWGSPQDFIAELQRQWAAEPQPERAASVARKAW